MSGGEDIRDAGFAEVSEERDAAEMCGVQVSATVTRADRELGYLCVWADTARWNEQAWIDTGNGDPGPRCIRAAQMIADVRLEAFRQGWVEGRKAMGEKGE